MPYAFPDVDDFKQQFARDFPYAVPAFGASALAVLSAGVVSSFTVTSPGTGYTQSPVVVLTAQPGDTGTGATATATVSAGGVVSLAVTAGGTGYGQAPSVSFSGGAGDDSKLDYVRDDDIEGAFLDAQQNCNPGLFPTQQLFTRAYLYLAAHQLIEKLKMAAAGVQSQYSWLRRSKSVGDAAESYEIPAFVKDNPFLAHLSTTRYGAMYCQIVAPLLVGNVDSHWTYTNP